MIKKGVKMFTEENAKKKWCPMVSNSNQYPFHETTDYDLTYHTKCITSDCMMWIVPDCEANKDFLGYCGLTK